MLKQERGLQQEYNHIYHLYDSLTEYQQTVRLQLELAIKLKEAENNIKKNNFIKMLNKQDEDLDKEHHDLSKKLDMVNTLKQKAVYFEKTNAIIVETKEEIIKNDNTILDFKQKNKQLSLQKLDLLYRNDNNKKEYAKHVQEGNVVNQKIDQFKKLDVTLIKLEKKIARLTNVINKRTENLQDIKGKINEVESLLNSDKTLINHEFKNSNYQKVVNSLKHFTLLLDVKREQRKKKEAEYEQFGKLKDDLNSIRKIGRHIIQSSEKSVCPLCSTNFPDFEALISQVDKNIDDVFKLKLIQEDIKEMDKDIEDLNSDFEHLLTSLKNMLKEDLKETQEKNKKESQKLIRVNLNFESINRQVTIIKEQLEELTFFFINHNPLFNKETFDKDTQIINEYILKIITEKGELINKEEQELKELNEQFNKNNELILSLEKYNMEKLAVNKFLKSETDYQTVINILDTFDISFDKGEIFEKENYLIEQLTLIKKKKDKVQLSIQENQFSQQDKDLFELQVIFQNIKDKDNKCIEFIERYVSNCKNYLQSTVVSETTFTEKLNNIKKDIDLKHELISYFDILHEKLQYTSEVLENSSKVKEKNDLITAITELNQVESKVSKLLKDSQKIIVEKINKAFNLNVINKIYSRIEPHPELNFMEIVPDFIDDKPSLEIYAPMGEERKDNPVIFFSSAQLDILSLSIFLAKALMEPTPVLNTIFMDDPVHHMDSVNVLSFIDLLRTITLDFDRQIVITTHNESLFRLIEKKIDPRYCNSKFIQLDSHGQVNQS